MCFDRGSHSNSEREREREREIAAGTHEIRSTRVFPAVGFQGKIKEIMTRERKVFLNICTSRRRKILLRLRCAASL